METETALLRVDGIGLGQWRLFQSVGRLQNIRRASEECNLSQPAVTQSIAKLESLIGLQLFYRRPSGSYLTELGSILHRRASRFFGELERAVAKLVGPDKEASAIVRRLTRSQIRSGILLVSSRISFAKAAQSCGVSAASLQRASNDLERNVGMQLFRRSASGVTGTPDGVEFGRRVKLAFQEIELGLDEVNAAQGKSRRRIAITAMHGGGSVLLGAVLGEYVATYPQACLSVTSSNAPEARESLLLGDTDIVIGLIPDTLHEELQAHPLINTPYEIVGRRGHPLLHRGDITVDELARYGWLVGTPSSNRRGAFEQLFEGHAGPETPIETCSMPVIRSLLTTSERLALMTSTERLYLGDMLAPIPVYSTGPAPVLGMLTRRNWLPTGFHQGLMQLLQRRVITAHVPRIVA